MSTNWQKKQCVVAAALNDAADTLEREAADLRREAQTRKRAYERQRSLKDLPSAIKHYIQLVDGGSSHENAIRISSAQFNLNRQTLGAAIFQNERAMRAYYRWKRDRRILTLAQRYSNEELADKFDLSAGRISQIIGKAWGRTSASGHQGKQFLIPDNELLSHHRANQRALKRRE